MNTATLKPVEEWEEAEIRALPEGEWDWLELKGAAWIEKDWQAKMSEYVSAWANYDGGYLVIGIANPSLGKPIEIEGVDLSSKKAFMEHLDMVVPRLVEPFVSKFTTQAISVKGGSRFVIVIHIPESDEAPHQAKDHKYYRRRGRHLDALSHRTVLDILNRRRHPKIKTYLLFRMDFMGEGNLHWKISNNSDVMARYVKAVIHFPTTIGNSFLTFEGQSVFLEEDETHSFWELRLTNGLSLLFPHGDIFKNIEVKGGNRFEGEQLKPSIDIVTVTTFADSMSPFVETFNIQDISR